jgi:hypothetical protein
MENPEEILSPKQAMERLKDLEYRPLPKRNIVPIKEQSGQRINPLKAHKRQTMKALGLKTGKQYRKYVKKLRQENRIGGTE